MRRLSKDDPKAQIGCDVKYAYFDVHSSCNSKDYSKLNYFFENHLKGMINYCNFTAIRVDRIEKKL